MEVEICDNKKAIINILEASLAMELNKAKTQTGLRNKK